MAGVLRAISEQAKKNTAAGGPDIPLGSGATAIGRNVAKAPGLPIPGDWAQVSGKHCRIVCSAAEGGPSFTVFDTSTNGTFIISDGQSTRVPKNGSLPLLPGQTLRLSILNSSGPSTVLEYQLELALDDSRVRKAADAHGEVGATPAKRLCFSGVSGSPEAASLPESKTLQDLRQINKDLQVRLTTAQGENDASRLRLKEQAAEVQQLTANLAAAHQQVLDTTTAVKAEAATQYEAKLVAATETSDGLAAQLKEQQQAAQAAEAANSGLTADLTTCRAKLEDAQRRCADTERQRDEAAAALAAEQSELQDKLEAAGAEAAQLREQLAQSAGELEAAQSRAEVATCAAERAHETAVALRQQLSDSQSELHSVREKQDHLEMNLRIARNELDGNKDNATKQQLQWAKVHDARQRRDEARARLAEQQRQVDEREQSLARETKSLGCVLAESWPAECNGVATAAHSAGGTILHTATQNTVEVFGPLQPIAAASGATSVDAAAATAIENTQAQAASAQLPQTADGIANGDAAASAGTPPRQPRSPPPPAPGTQQAAPAATPQAGSGPAETPAALEDGGDIVETPAVLEEGGFILDGGGFEPGQARDTLGVGVETERNVGGETSAEWASETMLPAAADKAAQTAADTAAEELPDEDADMEVNQDGDEQADMDVAAAGDGDGISGGSDSDGGNSGGNNGDNSGGSGGRQGADGAVSTSDDSLEGDEKDDDE